MEGLDGGVREGKLSDVGPTSAVAVGNQIYLNPSGWAFAKFYNFPALDKYFAKVGAADQHLRSSVLGGAIIEELNYSGQKSVGYVYSPEGKLLARQMPAGSNSYIAWKSNTPAGTTQLDYNVGGVFGSGSQGRIELDPLGANIGLTAPDPPDTGGGQGDVGGGHFGGIMDGRWSDFFNLSSGCINASFAASCSQAMEDVNMEQRSRAIFGERWYDLPGNNNESERAERQYAYGVLLTTINYIRKRTPEGTRTVLIPSELLQLQTSMGRVRVLDEANDRVSRNYDRCRTRVFGNATTFGDGNGARTVPSRDAAVLSLLGGGLGTDASAMVGAIWAHETNFVERPSGDAGPAQLTSWWNTNHPRLIVGNAYGTWRGRTNSPFDGNVLDNLETLGNIVGFSKERYGSWEKVAYWYGPGDDLNPRDKYKNEVMPLFYKLRDFFHCLSER